MIPAQIGLGPESLILVLLVGWLLFWLGLGKVLKGAVGTLLSDDD